MNSEQQYYPMRSRMLDAFESQEHDAELVGTFRIVREPVGVFDGKLYCEKPSGIAYVLGWLQGRQSVPSGSHVGARR